MTQKEWDRHKAEAITLQAGETFSIDTTVRPFETWIWRADHCRLERWYGDESGCGMQSYERPQSCIESEGRILRVLFRTDMPTREFVRLLLHKLEAGGAGLDVLGFSGIEEEKET
jgi:hypothetical protein